MKILGFVALALLATVSQAQVSDELCAGKPQNSFIAYPGDCQMYILCQNERAYPERCPQPGPGEIWFNPQRQACTPKGDFCTPPPCVGVDRQFVMDPNSACGGWIYCVNGEESHSDVCPYGLSFEQATQFCTYPLCPAGASATKAAPRVLM